MKLETIVMILLIHWLADFSLQTEWQAKNKCQCDKALTTHVTVYSLVWLIAASCMLQNLVLGCIFAMVTWLCHYITDFYTSRIGKPFWEKGDLHNGFTIVGFDQILHYLQLFGVYKLLSELSM